MSHYALIVLDNMAIISHTPFFLFFSLFQSPEPTLDFPSSFYETGYRFPGPYVPDHSAGFKYFRGEWWFYKCELQVTN